MSRKKNPLPALWQDFINQTPPPNELTLEYVMALRAEIDRLEMELALAKKPRDTSRVTAFEVDK